jgi:hypothetical protein
LAVRALVIHCAMRGNSTGWLKGIAEPWRLLVLAH